METLSSRRSFLKTGLIGIAALALAGGAYKALVPPSGPAKFDMDDTARLVFSALIPVLLKGALPAGGEGGQQALARVEIAIHSLPLHLQKEIGDLVKLLALGPARRLLTGIDVDWPQASAEQIGRFLNNWRTHRSPTLQSGYAALHDLVLGPWYGDESTWERIGYPGPIKELS